MANKGYSVMQSLFSKLEMVMLLCLQQVYSFGYSGNVKQTLVTVTHCVTVTSATDLDSLSFSLSEAYCSFSSANSSSKFKDQQTKELISAQKMSHKQQQRPELPTVLLPGMRVNTRYINSTRGTRWKKRMPPSGMHARPSFQACSVTGVHRHETKPIFNQERTQSFDLKTSSTCQDTNTHIYVLASEWIVTLKQNKA